MYTPLPHTTRSICRSGPVRRRYATSRTVTRRGASPTAAPPRDPRALTPVNPPGQRKPILEEGWAEPGASVTHAVLQITAGSRGAFTGALGNTLWVDNVRLEYTD